MSTNKVMMAISRGSESKEGGSITRYLGIGVMTVLAVNPTKAELEKVYGRTLEKEPEYLSKTEDNKDQVRITFYLATVPDKNNGIETIIPLSYTLENRARLNNDGTKVQVINKYGEVAWVTTEDARAGVIPANMSWFEGPYRAAFVGEENLTKFIKAFLSIPNKSFRKADGTVVELPNKEDAEVRFDSIARWFSGDISEIKNAVKYQPNNKVKVAVGVRTTDDGKTYQSIFPEMILKLGVTDFSRLEKAIEERKSAGAYATTDFSVEPLAEYGVAPTTFSKTEAPQASSDPFFE